MSQTRIEFNTSRHAEPPVLEGWYRCRLVRAERDINSSGSQTHAEARRPTGTRATRLDGLLVGRGSTPRGPESAPVPDDSAVGAVPAPGAPPDRRVRSARIRHARLPIHRCARGRRYGAGRAARLRAGRRPVRPRPRGPVVPTGLPRPGRGRGGGVPCPRPRRGRRLPPRYPRIGPGGPVRRPLRVHRGAVHPLPARVRALAGRPGRGHPRPAAPGAGRRRTSGPRRAAAPRARRAPARPRDRVHGHHLRPGRGAAAGRHPEAPIGTPRADTGVGVCDSGRRPVPPGTAREIHIGGPSPASGLFGNPERTARRFVTGPEPGGGRLCAVGDLGRILPDGNVELHGRGTTGPRSAATGSNRPRRNGCRPPTPRSPGPSSGRTPGPAARCRAVRPRPHPWTVCRRSPRGGAPGRSPGSSPNCPAGQRPSGCRGPARCRRTITAGRTAVPSPGPSRPP